MCVFACVCMLEQVPSQPISVPRLERPYRNGNYKYYTIARDHSERESERESRTDGRTETALKHRSP